MVGSSKGPAYSALRCDVDGEATPSENKIFTPSLLARLFSLNAWSFVSVILLFLFLGDQYQWALRRQEYLSIWATSDTDMPDGLLKLEKRRFTNAIRDDPNGNLYSSIDPSGLRYAGLPSPQIDENWNDLISGRYFRLEEPEISLLNRDPSLPALTEMPRNERISQQGFYGGPDFLHSLHCLNAIRKHLDMDYYANSMTLPPEYRRMHIDHCVDHLRQALLCHGDLTPVTMKPVVANSSLPYGVTFYLGQTEREHTCRSAEALRDWVTARGQRTGRIEPHRPVR